MYQPLPSPAVYRLRTAGVTSVVVGNSDNNREAWNMGQQLLPWVTQGALPQIWPETWPPRLDDFCPLHTTTVEMTISIFGLKWSISYLIVWISLINKTVQITYRPLATLSYRSILSPICFQILVFMFYRNTLHVSNIRIQSIPQREHKFRHYKVKFVSVI
jgi:hypothetical protein